ncbi:hypothetical protein DPMN_083495 [Dreissena polymorpha]|uniref:Uncharacterized protein n=1 Tax=Dreissena polymorpha TaxID=45954 RepID=A0A9D3Y900_DREPO|nr:hypothetical protein DPMN_083495 [Dreissena polymorpha]
MYQKKDLCYSEVTLLLTAIIQTLEHLSETRSGLMMKKILKVTPQTPETDKDGLFTFEYEGHTITDKQKMVGSKKFWASASPEEVHKELGILNNIQRLNTTCAMLIIWSVFKQSWVH